MAGGIRQRNNLQQVLASSRVFVAASAANGAAGHGLAAVASTSTTALAAQSSPQLQSARLKQTFDEECYWKHNLYLLQERAPRPRAVPCTQRIENRPLQYGAEFHGLIERPEADRMLKESGEGAYLVRESKRSTDAYTLCMFFDQRVLNYMLYYDGSHYVGDKRFDTVDLLVADGLISMYIDKHASDYVQRMAEEAIYEHSPYQQYQASSSALVPSSSSAPSDSISNSSASKQQTTIPSIQPRIHSFHPHTFRLISYCDFCRNFLWGLVSQGVRCEDCGFAAHLRCSERTRPDCRPDSKYVKRMFGVDLTTFFLAHGQSVPPVVVKAIAEVECRGLSVEGIYRVSGSHEQIDKLSKQFDASHAVDLSQVEDIHTVCGLLKLYLRRLPQQLVPFSVYKQLLAAFVPSYTMQHERIKACRKALEELEEANARTLQSILHHLAKVADHSFENKMTVENLATIFSPTVFYTGVTPSLAQQQHMLLHFLITTPRIVPYN